MKFADRLDVQMPYNPVVMLECLRAMGIHIPDSPWGASWSYVRGVSHRKVLVA